MQKDKRTIHKLPNLVILSKIQTCDLEETYSANDMKHYLGTFKMETQELNIRWLL
jgi:hypothetical protein